MKFQDDIDFTTLGWIKSELDATLLLARTALEAHVENPSAPDQMRLCISHLHLVHGTLRMVELYGAALVVEEMERVAQGLADGSVAPSEDVYSVLMRGIVQLPDYLERLQSGHKDIPIILLPLLNDLRATRGEKLLSESVLFTPDMSVALPEALGPGLSPTELRRLALRLRKTYQKALLHWFRDDNTASQLERICDVLDRLYAGSVQSDTRRLWWVANGVLDGMRSGDINASVAIKLLFGKIDREIKRVVDEGERAFVITPPRDLTKNLLYYLAHSSVKSDRAVAIRQLYRLDSLLPSAAELEHAHGSISGHNRALLDTVAAAIKDDLLHVKEALDIFLRSSDQEVGDLGAQTDVLDRVADTLGMLGLGVPRRVVIDQRQTIADISTGQRKADEATLLDVAGSLLYVEASLDDHIVRLGVDNLAEGSATKYELPKAEVGRILDALMREAAANIAQTKQDIVAFVEAPWDHSRVEQIPRLLEEVSGALDMLSLRDAAQLITGIIRFVETELLQHRRVPNHEQLDTLADALASIEYYIEATREQRGGREKILEITRGSLRALNYWPLPAPVVHRNLPEALALVQEPSASADTVAMAPASAPAHQQQSAYGSAPSIGTSALAAPIPAGAPSPDVPDPDAVNHGIDFGFSTDPAHTLDGEIRDIFLEEVEEEIASLQTNLPLWCAETDDMERLRTMRRSFHTLKGSGRLVGAQALGDFSWKIENMLNRVLDKTIVPNHGVQALLAHAIGAMPDFVVALRDGIRPAVDIVVLKDVADRLAAGDEAFVDEAALRPKKRSGVAPAGSQDTFDNSEPGATQYAPRAYGDSLPQLDPLLFDVLRTEVSAHLDVIDAFVAQSELHATPVTPALLRATHTLNGAIAMVDLTEASQTLVPLESYIKRLQAWQQAPDAEGIAALAEVSASIKATITALEKSSSAIPDFTALTARIIDLRDGLAEPELLHSLLASEEEAQDSYGELDVIDAGTTHDQPTTPAKSDAPFVTDARVSGEGRAPIKTMQQGSDDEAIAAALAAIAYAQTDSLPASEPIEPRDLGANVPHFGTEPLTHSSPQEAQAPIANEYVPASDQTSNDTSEAQSESTYVQSEIVEQASVDADLYAESQAAVQSDALFDAPQATFEPVSSETESTAGADFAHMDAAEAPYARDDSDRPKTSTSTSAKDASVEEHAPAEMAAAKHTFESALAEPSEQAAVKNVQASAPATSLGGGFDVASENAALAPIASESVSAASAPDFQIGSQTDPLYAVPEIDEDLLEIFVQEADEILDHADALMARLREAPQDRDVMAGLQRDLHTVKGGAHMSGLTPIGDLGHAMESLLEAVAEHRRDMNDVAVVALEQGFDRLHALVQLVARRQPSPMPVALISRVERLVSGELEPAAQPVTQPTIQSERSAHYAGAVETAPDAPATFAESTAPIAAAITPRPAPPAAEDDDAQMRPSQDYIRVRADLVDAMVNNAGEVAIYRSRLEQQIAGYRFNLVELDATVTRLREQLRKLELETEAQILSRYQRADEAGLSTFDPLELDRFSQLQQLSRSLSESVSDLSSIQGTFDDLTRQSETLLLQQSRVNSDLQEGLMRTRMVPFDSLVPALRRTLRQTATELGKRAQLKVEGAQGEMDRNLLERMKAPFEHMLRNSLAHGIEMPADRERANKPSDGTVNIAVSREATEVVLRVSDDGQGLNRNAIRAKAIERGLISSDAVLSDRDLYALILETGFSTAESITQLAGRGVGMDVVNNEIKQLGGSLSIDSNPGAGAVFTVRLPFTLAVTQAILVRLGDFNYAIPMSAVQGVVRIAHGDLDKRMSVADAAYAYAGESFAIHDLSQLLGVATSHVVDEAQVPLLMTRSGDQRAAVRVDAVLGSREIVVKSVGPQISSVPGIFGATIMGNGSVVMILDLAPLLRRAATQRAQERISGIAAIAPPPIVVPAPRHRTLVMVVDDSITMRKVTTRVLERQDMDVVTAKDGLDAVEKLQDRIPDIVVLDIEMPRMDGYEFATYMKNDPRTRKVPIIMVTSRTGEKHRQRAQEIGVERYLGKPYQEAELLQNIAQALGALK